MSDSYIVRLYARLLLVLLPAEVGAEYAADAAEMFRDRLREAATRFARAKIVVRSLADLVVQSVAMRWESAGRAEREARTGRRAVRAFFTGLPADARHVSRQWLRSPGFAVAVLATLGIGTGVSTAMFGVVNGVVLRPLPFPRSDRLAMVWERNLERGWPRFTVSPANFFDWRGRATSFASMSAYTRGTATLTGSGDPARLQVVEARWNVFDVVGVHPVLGRAYSAAENEIGSDDVILLSHRLWAGRFGADSTILEHSVVLDGRSRRVVGVLPASFGLANDADAWVPLVFPFDVPGARGARYLSVVGRLRPGVSPAAAQTQMDAITTALAREYVEADAGWSAAVVPLREQLLHGVDRTLLLLFGAVGLLMLIACANVANLLLVRGTSRRDEFSLRKALGAAPGRLGRQVVVETIVTSAAGAVLGILVAYGLTRLLVALEPAGLPRATDISIDARVFGFCAALALVTGTVVGLLPAVQAARSSTSQGAGQRAHTSARRGRRVRNALLIAQIALAVMLVAGWGLVARSLWSLASIDPGFNAAGLTVARLSPPASRYPEPADRDAFFDAVTSRLRALPIIERVGVANRLPLTGSLRFGVTADRQPVPPAPEWASGELRAIDPDYFPALGIPLLRGRSFASTDDATSTPVIILNESMARSLFPAGDAIGGRVLVSSADASCPCEVVGVVADVLEAGLDQPPTPVYYLPQSQSVWTTRSLVIRSASPLPAVAAALREAVSQVDDEIAIFDLQPLGRLVAARLASPRFNTLLLGVFAALALFLAMIGVYGVTARVVFQRQRELGVRSALGAGTRGLVWLVEREALLIAATGIIFGLAGAAATTRLLRGMLFGVNPMDPTVIVGVAIFLAAVCAIAALVPAWRAGRIDPVRALRMD